MHIDQSNWNNRERSLLAIAVVSIIKERECIDMPRIQVFFLYESRDQSDAYLFVIRGHRKGISPSIINNAYARRIQIDYFQFGLGPS